jgi:D-alanyl-D-alanine carboxypeptidase/D-alanyl-D-alanine-endopeptidase (penicillin-binding protein 4)
MSAWVQALPELVWPAGSSSPQRRSAPTIGVNGVARPGILSVQADRPMNPASVMKLVTTAVAMQALGADFQWQTTVWIDGAVRDGVLYGDLIVEGGGDPYLPTPRVQDLIGRIRAQGIRSIHGDILVDQKRWRLPRFDPAAFDGKPDRPYNAEPQALMLNMQALELRVQPQGSVALLAADPPLWGMSQPASVALNTAPCIQPEQGLALDMTQPQVLQAKGAWPRSCGARSVFVALYPQAEAFPALALAGLWQAGGGQLQGQAGMAVRGHGAARRLFSFPSAPLQEVVTVTNTYSNNPMAKQIFLSLPVWGKLRGQRRRPVGSWQASQHWMAAWWRLHLPQATPPILENGSGLSRRERITAASLGALLMQTAASPVGSDFAATLPLAGREGTVTRLAQRAPQNRALGQARLKTGTLDEAKAIAGYVRGKGDQVYGVVGLINAPQAAAGQTALDALLDWVAGN